MICNATFYCFALRACDCCITSCWPHIATCCHLLTVRGARYRAMNRISGITWSPILRGSEMVAALVA